jgi:WD40 repeat protein
MFAVLTNLKAHEMTLRSVLLMIVFMVASSGPLQAQNNFPLQTVWSPDGERIALFDQRELVIYVENLIEIQRVTVFAPDERVTALNMVWSPQQDKIAIHANGHFHDDDAEASLIRIWDVESGEQVGQIDDIPFYPEMDEDNVSYSDIVQLAWTPDGEHLSLITPSDSTTNWPIDIYTLDGHKVDTIMPPSASFIGQAWTDDGQFLITVSQEYHSLSVSNAQTHEFIHRPVWKGSMPEVYLSPSSSYGASITDDNAYLQVWAVAPQVKDLYTEFSIPYPGGDFPYAYVGHLQFGWQDSNHLWSLGVDNSLYIWRLKTTRPIARYTLDTYYLQSISPDGTRALYGEGQELRLEEIKTGKVLAHVTMDGNVIFTKFDSPLRDE